MTGLAEHTHHHADPGAAGLLGGAFWIALGILVAEAVGGVISHSLALFGDAAHMLTDVLSLALAWYASRLSQRPPTPQRTYGFHRAGILAALFNAAALGLVAVIIMVEAAIRLAHPVPVIPWIMLTVAGGALAGNLAMGLRLDHHAHRENLNIRSAWLHAMGDALASAGVIAAGILVIGTHHFFWDALVSMGISLLVARGAWGIVSKTMNVLMEGVPRGMDSGKVAAFIEADAAVLSVHHVHLWSLDGTRCALSGHLVLRDARVSETETIIARISERLAGMGIDHTTLQVETALCPQCDCAPGAAESTAKTGPPQRSGS